MGTAKKIKDTNNSIIIQADGRSNCPIIVNNGISKDEVLTICREVVADELVCHAAKGKIVTEERFQMITDKIIEKLSTLENDLTSRFEDPAVQMSTRELIKNYIRVGDGQLGDQLVDILIDRLKEDGRTVSRAVIDEAISILPNLSDSSVAFLALLVLSSVVIPAECCQFQRLLGNLSELLEPCHQLSDLDIAYLKQVGCCYGSLAIVQFPSLEERFLSSYDLFFRHPISMDDFNAIIASYPSELSLGDNGLSNLRFVLSMMESPIEGVEHFKNIATKHLELNLSFYHKDNLRAVFESIKRGMKAYDRNEVREELKAIDPIWEPVFDRFAQPMVRCLQLHPVGYYIGQKRLGSLIKMDVPLEFFYQ